MIDQCLNCFAVFHYAHRIRWFGPAAIASRHAWLILQVRLQWIEEFRFEKEPVRFTARIFCREHGKILKLPSLVPHERAYRFLAESLHLFYQPMVPPRLAIYGISSGLDEKVRLDRELGSATRFPEWNKGVHTSVHGASL
ncbi:MAG: hypothetical protein DMG21_15405 [Acidobacteria bacterium]|nr:MAG: hypothetical protein DMG21_15405 [Acidobacteriota bacterium]